MSAVRGAALACAIALWCPSARANGRFPAAQDVWSSGDVVALRATFGVLVSYDRARTFHWVCEAELYDPHFFTGTLDPPIAVDAAGRVWWGFPRGARSTPDGCRVDDDPTARDRAVVDLTRSDRGAVVWALVHDDAGSFVTRTTSDGVMERLGDLASDTRWTNLDVAPGDASRVYASGATTSGEGVLARSDDGGRHFVTVPRDGAPEGAMYLSGIDPTRADVVYARVTEGLGTALWRSDDAGRRWARALTAQGPMLGFAVSSDGATVWAGGPDDGLWRSDDRGVTFARVSSFGPYCLRHDGAALWACADWTRAPFALGRSTDGGRHFDAVLRFDDVIGPFVCDPSQHGPTVCGWQWPGVSSQLLQARASIDASVGADATAEVVIDGASSIDAARVAPSIDRGGCSCGVSSERGRGEGALAALAVWIRSRRRRRAGPTDPSTCSSSGCSCRRCG